ncbi:MAG: hypothetical protein JKY19_03340 [Alcanivoracaceae bacterium]|nr:hypothetical protein [Alcanivoracaceae bacterium]
MKINLLHILIVLVALQSTIAVADLHQSHQTGKEHLEFDHIDIDNNNEYSEKIPDITSSIDNFTPYDCHHCCHCHGVACHYLDNQQKKQFTHIDASPHLRKNFYFCSRSTSPSLRPPIV